MKPSLQEEIIQNSVKTTTTTTKPSSNTKQVQNSQQTQQAAHQKCPRCDSTNTKFCYYNNYSLTQPRYFCKTCRRYWTKGGALRNVPIGGASRKTKKLKSNSSSASSSTNNFQFGLSMPLFSCSRFSLDHHQTPTTLMGINFNNNNNNNQLASSIESLSSLNQDLHWKLQQQRLAVMFGDHDQQHQVQNFDQNQKLLQPILFQNLEIPKFNNHAGNECVVAAGEGATTTTEWFFGNNNNHHHHQMISARNDIDGSGWSHDNHTNGVQAWEDLHHFTALP